MIYVPIRKNRGTDFRNLNVKCLANFLYISNLDLVSRTA